MPDATRPGRTALGIGRRLLVAGFMLSAASIPSAAAPSARTNSTDSPVADAVMRRDSVRVRMLLKQGADVNASQGDGMTALHWAAAHGDAAQARMLVYAGARLEAATRNGNYTPLHLASKAGNTAVVAALLDAGANVNAVTTSGGATPLHLAAAQGDTTVLVALLARGAQVNARETAFGQTPLMWAAAANRVNAVRLLVARGADLKATSKVEDVSAREKAEQKALTVRTKRMAALRAAEQAKPAGGATASPGALPNAGKDSAAVKAKTDSTTDDDGTSAKAHPAPDSAAAKAGEPKAPETKVEKQSEKKVDGAAKKNAAAAGDAKTGPAADSLKSKPPAPKALSYGDLVGNSGGLTPLLFAVRQGNVESATALIKAGADVNQVSQGDHTSPLLMAAVNGHFDLAKLLLSNGADPKLASDAGTTPLYATLNVQWAAKSLYPQPTAQLQQETTYLELMEALIKAGADVNARLTKHLWFMSYNFDLLGVNTEGATPFWRAAYGTDVPAMKLLIAHGADPKIPTKKAAGRLRGDDTPAEVDSASRKDPSGLPPIDAGGPGVYPIHAASGVGYGEGYAANSHRHAPDGWIPSVKYLIEVLGADVNARDLNGYTPLHHAAARGDNALINYLMEKGADVSAVSRKGQTVADMANGPFQRTPPFPETVALLEKLGSKNNHKCKSC